MKIIELNDKTKKNILENLLKRSPNQYKEYTETVDRIINDVRDNGDKALFSYTKKFDKVDINADNIRVTDEEIQKAYQDVSQDVIDVIRKAKDNIEEFLKTKAKQLVRCIQGGYYSRSEDNSHRKGRNMFPEERLHISLQYLWMLFLPRLQEYPG